MQIPNTAVAVVAIASVLASTSCSFAAPATQNIVVRPNHPEADVSVDGAPVGKGTQAIALDRTSAHTATANCGNSTGVAHIGKKISSEGVMDLIGGLLVLVPFIGVAAPGFWELSPSTVVVVVPDASQCADAVIEVPPGEPGS
jgi:hypothetical protein